ncbi:MAG: enoyl-CoA hydratase/isomerase family protein [Chloroflexi bacterium]|nr:enoyl-CoA hydratase/isomerase family protein [Chloroflexota bacterium]
MAYETILLEKKGRIAYLTMNQPESLNALSFKMSEEIMDACQNVDEDDNIYVMVLTGAGRGFAVGANMKEAARASRTGEHGGGYGGHHAMEKMQKPVIGAINGICAGGGLIMLGGCDIVICSDDSTFLDPHVSVGWLPLSETFATVTHIPFGLAMRMALLGTTEKMSAERAYQVGLVSEVVPKDKLMERATQLAEQVAAQAPLAVRYIRQVMRRMFHEEPYARSMEEANRWVHGQVNRSHDGIEGPRAFSEKRKAQWNAEGGPNQRVNFS